MKQSEIHLESIAPQIWGISKPFYKLKINLGSRMTIVQLDGGGLFLISPIQLNAEVRRHLETLGQVQYVIAPNCMHHLFIKEYFAYYPHSSFWAAPGLEAKRPDLEFQDTLSAFAPPEWSKVLDQHVIAGAPQLNEVVFFHKPTQTLILTDIAFNVGHVAGLWNKIFYKLNAMEGFGPTRYMKAIIKDREAFGESIAKIQSWNPQRIVLAHGAVVEKEAPQLLEKAFDWLNP
jgi:hypothetical protein